MMQHAAIVSDGGAGVDGMIVSESSMARLDRKRTEKYDDRQICRYITLRRASRAAAQEKGQ
jgi:hypothetical protein